MSKSFSFRIASRLLIFLVCMALQAPWIRAHADSLPSLTNYGVGASTTLMFPEKVQGTVFSVLPGGQFIMNEKKHLICRETEINGQPATAAKYKLVSGTKISLTRYRLKNKNYFVSSMTILSR